MADIPPTLSEGHVVLMEKAGVRWRIVQQMQINRQACLYKIQAVDISGLRVWNANGEFEEQCMKIQSTALTKKEIQGISQTNHHVLQKHVVYHYTAYANEPIQLIPEQRGQGFPVLEKNKWSAIIIELVNSITTRPTIQGVELEKLFLKRVYSMAEGLRVLHSCNLVHGDYKLDNLCDRGNDNIVMIDMATVKPYSASVVAPRVSGENGTLMTTSKQGFADALAARIESLVERDMVTPDSVEQLRRIVDGVRAKGYAPKDDTFSLLRTGCLKGLIFFGTGHVTFTEAGGLDYEESKRLIHTMGVGPAGGLSAQDRLLWVERMFGRIVAQLEAYDHYIANFPRLVRSWTHLPPSIKNVLLGIFEVYMERSSLNHLCLQIRQTLGTASQQAFLNQSQTTTMNHELLGAMSTPPQSRLQSSIGGDNVSLGNNSSRSTASASSQQSGGYQGDISMDPEGSEDGNHTPTGSMYQGPPDLTSDQQQQVSQGLGAGLGASPSGTFGAFQSFGGRSLQGGGGEGASHNAGDSSGFVRIPPASMTDFISPEHLSAAAGGPQFNWSNTDIRYYTQGTAVGPDGSGCGSNWNTTPAATATQSTNNFSTASFVSIASSEGSSSSVQSSVSHGDSSTNTVGYGRGYSQGLSGSQGMGGAAEGGYINNSGGVGFGMYHSSSGTGGNEIQGSMSAAPIGPYPAGPSMGNNTYQAGHGQPSMMSASPGTYGNPVGRTHNTFLHAPTGPVTSAASSPSSVMFGNGYLTGSSSKSTSDISMTPEQSNRGPNGKDTGDDLPIPELHIPMKPTVTPQGQPYIRVPKILAGTKITVQVPEGDPANGEYVTVRIQIQGVCSCGWQARLNNMTDVKKHYGIIPDKKGSVTYCPILSARRLGTLPPGVSASDYKNIKIYTDRLSEFRRGAAGKEVTAFEPLNEDGTLACSNVDFIFPS